MSRCAQLALAALLLALPLTTAALLLALPLTAAGQLREDPGDPHGDHGMPMPGDPAVADPHAGHAPPPPRGARHAPAPHTDHDAVDALAGDGAAAGDAGAHADHDAGAGAHADHDAGAGAHTGHDAGGAHHGHRGMVLDADGMVMNHNPDELPRDCPRVAGDVELRVRAGRSFAAGHGLAWGYDVSEWQVPPCSRVRVTLENEDAVRHQWMVHGLPRYLYPKGMFTIEVNGPGTRSASFIVPSGDATYLVHCDVPHHMEKGMKGQLVVGAGGETLPSVPRVSAALVPDRYPSDGAATPWWPAALAAGLGVALSLGLLRA